MTTKCICTTNTTCSGQIYRPTQAGRNSEKSGWAGLRRLAATIGVEAVEIFCYSNNPVPVFTNGGTRVLIRPDRIDLV